MTTMVYNGNIKLRLFEGINDTVLALADWKNETVLHKKLDTAFNTYYPTAAPKIAWSVAASIDGSMAMLAAPGLWKITGQMDSIWLHPYTEYEFSWGAGTSQSYLRIIPTSDGGYAMIGDTWNGIVDNIYLIKTDAMGNKQFGQMYWSVTSHNVDVVQANDGGYVMLNTVPGIWIVKTDQNGTIGVADSKFFNNEVVLYPNPTNSLINLQFSQNTTAQLTIYNIAGQQVFTDDIYHSKAYQSSLSLPNGLYIIHIQTENQLFTKKLIVKN